MPSRCFMPCDRCRTGLSCRVRQADLRQHLVDRLAPRRRRPEAEVAQRPATGQLGRQRRRLDQEPAQTQGGQPAVTMSWPAIGHSPASGRTSPAITRRVVLLPAPFGPSRPTTSPGATAIETPRRPGRSETLRDPHDLEQVGTGPQYSGGSPPLVGGPRHLAVAAKHPRGAALGAGFASRRVATRMA